MRLVEAIQSAHPLATTNAALNLLATLLLVAGWLQIKARRENAHKWTMLSAFGTSVLFLCSYLAYHYQVGSVKFSGYGAIRYVYFAILITHVALAALVPFLAGATIYFGLREKRESHRRIARITFPIWLYVSITGVVIYVMVYGLYPADKAALTITETLTR